MADMTRERFGQLAMQLKDAIESLEPPQADAALRLLQRNLAKSQRELIVDLLLERQHLMGLLTPADDDNKAFETMFISMVRALAERATAAGDDGEVGMVLLAMLSVGPDQGRSWEFIAQGHQRFEPEREQLMAELGSVLVTAKH